MANSVFSGGIFARNQLTKYGWEDGKGLGKKSHGMKNPIKVSVKNNNHGLGLDQSEQFVFHWWDHVFNKVADSIKVEENDGEVKVTKEKRSDQVSSISSQRPNNISKGKDLLYGRFVRSGTYDASCDKYEPKSDESNSDEAVDFSNNDTLEKVFKLSGGRTAHKAARHGHRLNGKLKRLQEQEQTSTSQTSNSSSESFSIEASKSAKDSSDSRKIKRKKPLLKRDSVDDKFMCSNHDPLQTKLGKKLKKVKKEKQKVTENSDVDCSRLQIGNIGDSDALEKHIQKKKKRRKREKMT